MDYAYAVKTLPQPEADPAADPAAPPPPEPQPPQQDDARPWAGDVYDEGDETDPAQAFAAFSGQAGEQAWLDKAEDGTLTGWVRDETGQVWRYSDPDAWAIDVDDSGMAQTGGTGAAAGGPGADPAEGEQAAAPGAGTIPAPEDAPPLDFGTADEVVPVAGDPATAPEEPTDPAGEDELAAETDEEEPEEDEEAEDENPFGKGKKAKP
ncbi:hypothetical protein PL81_20200 [Streptomyces sp. RSD-27]|nr:hypothetical protein PL81_20200 [Streptomyces sp. RSD-27]